MGDTFFYRGKTYIKLTGYEGVDGICWWCGKSFSSKRSRHCCCSDCTRQYDKHFRWGEARRWAMKRSNNHCQECGAENQCVGYNMKSSLEVHHIIPLPRYEDYFYNILNCPCNLIVLCLSCHGKTRKKKSPQLKFETICRRGEAKNERCNNKLLCPVS